MRVVIFNSSGATDVRGADGAELHQRRIAEEDITGLEGVEETTAFVCGPPTYMAAVRGWLASAGLAADRVREESFEF